VRKSKTPTDRSGGGIAIARTIAETASTLATHSSDPVGACGIGFCGPVDFRQQKSVKSLHVGGWENISLARQLSEALGVPAIMDNNGNVGALGEAMLGAARGKENVVYMTLSTGVAGGILINGKVYRGSRNIAAELGHVKVVSNDETPFRCYCGRRGCLESVCSVGGIRAITERRMKAPLSPRELFEAANQGDMQAADVIEEITGYLARGIASVAHTLDPDVIVIGGGVARAGDVLFEPLYLALKSELMSAYDPRTLVVPAALGDDSVLIGAVALARTLEPAPTSSTHPVSR